MISAPHEKHSLFKTVFTSMIGNIFEWYDFALFGYFAPIIGKLYFPSSDHLTELISAFGVFAAGFVVRPLGGLFFGYVGDKFGRKSALVLTILLMAIPTVLIGLLPTYESIGIFASILLVVLRMFQGLSMGGNYSGSITFTSEHSDQAHKGLIGSLSVASCLVGIMLGSATAALFSHFFNDQELYAWGWRIPFLLGVTICVVGLYMRAKIAESPEFLKEKELDIKKENPLKILFNQHKKNLALAVLISMLHDLSFYVLFVYMTTYLTEVLGVEKSVAFTINTVNLVLVTVITILAGLFSDRLGRKKLMLFSAILFVFFTIPLMKLMGLKSIFLILSAQMFLAVAVGGFFGPLPALLVEIFPTSVRYSAISLTTNISGPLFGGTAPMVVTYLIQKTNSSLVPAYYLSIAALISFLALSFLKLSNSKKG